MPLETSQSFYMATLEVRIKYQTSLSRFLFWSLTLASPLWFFLPLAVWTCWFFSGRGFYERMNLPLESELLRSIACVGLGTVPLFLLGLMSWRALRNHQLVISQQGIVFPLLSCVSLWGRRNRPWYDLSGVRLERSLVADDFRKEVITLHYRSGGFVRLPLDSFSATDVEQLVLGIENFAENADGVNLLPRLKTLLKNELKIEGNKSYTNLWEDELRYRYSATTFIPLTPASTLQDGQIKILRQLGFGGLSAIYLVQRNKKELAILKESVLPADVDTELKAKAEEQFEREARILASLDHPQIAKVLDHFVERGHYLLLEYIHGLDLRQFVSEKGALVEKEVLEFALQIADILEYLHKREPPIIHRDLTPENLIVNDKGKIVLIDFGAANEFLHTATGTLVGKHAYMAPEQLKGKAETLSDLYALGASMHFLLTGKDPLPLSASHPSKVNPEVSAATDALVCKLTQQNKETRCRDISELRETLRIILGAS